MPPPGRIALGGSDGEENPFDLPRLLIILGLPPDVYASALEATMALNERLQSDTSSSTRDLLLEELRRQRAEVAEQVELEMVVRRPPPKGNTVWRKEDDRPAALQRQLEMMDGVIGKFEGSESDL